MAASWSTRHRKAWSIREHTRSVPECAITLCAAAALAHSCRALTPPGGFLIFNWMEVVTVRIPQARSSENSSPPLGRTGWTAASASVQNRVSEANRQNFSDLDFLRLEHAPAKAYDDRHVLRVLLSAPRGREYETSTWARGPQSSRPSAYAGRVPAALGWVPCA